MESKIRRLLLAIITQNPDLIDLNDRDKKLLWESLRRNKKMLKSMDVSKKEFDMSIFDAVYEALDYKYSAYSDK